MEYWRFKFFYRDQLLLEMLVFCLLWHVQIVFIFFTASKYFIFGVRSIQPINWCFTEYEVWHPTHHGGCSCLSRYEWVMSVCPIRRRDRIISSLRDFLYPSFYSLISAFIVWSLSGVLFHLSCHLFWVKFFISILKSVYGILKILPMGNFQAVLAAESAWSFPLIPMWIGNQHSSISLVFDKISNLFNSCIVRWLSRFCFFRGVKTDKEKWWIWWMFLL